MISTGCGLYRNVHIILEFLSFFFPLYQTDEDANESSDDENADLVQKLREEAVC